MNGERDVQAPADATQGVPGRGTPHSLFPLPPSHGFDVDVLRTTEFPWTSDTVYLNNASIGPLPERTRLALDRFNLRRAAPHLLPDREMFAMLADTRQKIARLIGAAPDEIALAPNTTYGISMAARALPLERGDIVLVSDKEFPANVYPWMRLGDRGATMELVPTTPEGWPDEARLLERLRDPRVRVLAVSLVQFSSGYLVDLARLSAATRETGAYLAVDAIQGVGQLPVDVSRVQVDVLACGGQKWLLSPWGSGFVYVRRELIARLDPAITGWLAFEGTEDLSRLTSYNDALLADARRFELMTLPYQDFAGLNSSLDLLLELGIERIRDHIRALHEPVLAWAERSGARVASPRGASASGILCVSPPEVKEVHRRLKRSRIICSLREGAIRLSPHCYNTVEEMERVAQTLAGD